MGKFSPSFFANSSSQRALHSRLLAAALHVTRGFTRLFVWDIFVPKARHSDTLRCWIGVSCCDWRVIVRGKKLCCPSSTSVYGFLLKFVVLAYLFSITSVCTSISFWYARLPEQDGSLLPVCHTFHRFQLVMITPLPAPTGLTSIDACMADDEAGATR